MLLIFVLIGLFFAGYLVRDANAKSEIRDAKGQGALIFCLDVGDENGDYLFNTEECPNLVRQYEAANAFATPLSWYQDRSLIAVTATP